MFKKLALLTLLLTSEITECKKQTSFGLSQYMTLRNVSIGCGTVGVLSGITTFSSTNEKTRHYCKCISPITLGIAGTTLFIDTILKNRWLITLWWMPPLVAAEYYYSSQDHKKYSNNESASDLLKQVQNNVNEKDQNSKKGPQSHFTQKNAQQFFRNTKKESSRNHTVITLM